MWAEVEEGSGELGELDVLTVKTDVVLLVIQGSLISKGFHVFECSIHPLT